MVRSHDDPSARFAENLRRLLLFEHTTAKEAAQELGFDETTISRWLTGQRWPTARALIAIEKLYGVSAGQLDSDPKDFARRLTDRARIDYAANEREKHLMEVTKQRVAQIKAKRATAKR